MTPLIILGAIALAVIVWAIVSPRIWRKLPLPLEIGRTGTYLVMPNGTRRKLLDHPARMWEIDNIIRQAEIARKEIQEGGK
jgi:hypothetical protein